MFFIGQTRFSLFNPKSSSWKATNGRFSTPEAYESFLYSETRMSVRCKIFIEHSLPQLEAASRGHDISHVVSYSSNLPKKYQEQLEMAAERYSFVLLDRHEAGRQPVDLDDLARAHFQRWPDDVPVYGTYRLDDDDLLTVDYFEQMAQHLRIENVGMQVSLAAGLTALYEDGRYTNVRVTHWPMLAIGLLSICGIGEDGSVVKPVHAPHHLSDLSNPVILDSRRLSYLWVRHVDQDTAMDFTKASARDNVVKQMSKYPEVGISVNVRDLFPRLASAFNVNASTVLVHKTTPVQGVVDLPFNTQLDAFKLLVDAEFGTGVVPGNALFSLDLVGSEGSPLSQEQRSSLAPARIATSANLDVGHYRYLDTSKAGRSEVLYDFQLPYGVFCRGVRLRHWKKSTTEIVLHRVLVKTKV